MQNSSIPTRADAIRAAEAAGLTGEAANLFAAAGAPTRHAARVAAARVAALAWAGPLRPGDLEPNLQQLAVAWAATHLDAHGVGGPRAAGGAGSGTTRHPAFAGLGAGRKFARDGAAWTAAIAGAAHGLALELDPDRADPALTIDADGRFVVVVDGGKWPISLPDREEESDHREAFARSLVVAAAAGATVDPAAIRGAGIVVNRAHAARVAAIAAREAREAEAGADAPACCGGGCDDEPAPLRLYAPDED